MPGKLGGRAASLRRVHVSIAGCGSVDLDDHARAARQSACTDPSTRSTSWSTLLLRHRNPTRSRASRTRRAQLALRAGRTPPRPFLDVESASPTLPLRPRSAGSRSTFQLPGSVTGCSSTAIRVSARLVRPSVFDLGPEARPIASRRATDAALDAARLTIDVSEWVMREIARGSTVVMYFLQMSCSRDRNERLPPRPTNPSIPSQRCSRARARTQASPDRSRQETAASRLAGDAVPSSFAGERIDSSSHGEPLADVPRHDERIALAMSRAQSACCRVMSPAALDGVRFRCDLTIHPDTL